MRDQFIYDGKGTIRGDRLWILEKDYRITRTLPGVQLVEGRCTLIKTQ